MKFNAIAAGFAIIVTLLSNAGKIIDWSSGCVHYGLEQVGTIIVYPRITRNFFAKRALVYTYDGQACLDRSAPASLDEDGRPNDLMVDFFHSRSGRCDDENDTRVSSSFYAYRNGSFEFVADVSSYKCPGLTSENVGTFLIETVTGVLSLTKGRNRKLLSTYTQGDQYRHNVVHWLDVAVNTPRLWQGVGSERAEAVRPRGSSAVA
ncbi:hypothetical protein [Rhizobium leguminosarum]|uniref:hypothetical protein n=1 Tax=Rhizobium leguminosarum TaxID=384 RepID=UPI00102F508D|nr:hypothetical protein [Rhizobium leguminosarum]TAY87719.1 hypothetical protein ELH83_07735 [Rhizobium leguminosarum]